MSNNLYTSNNPQEAHIETGELLSVCCVSAANVVRDIRENIRNLVGGKMVHYETLIQQTLERAFAELDQKAKEKGYDGVLSVKVAHPSVVEGGVEIIVYGNGFRYKAQQEAATVLGNEVLSR